MKRIEPSLVIRPSAMARNYLQVLKDNKTFDRMIDAYLFAAAFAIKKDLDISEITLTNRQDLIDIDAISPDVRLVLEASIHIIGKRNYRPEPLDSKEVLELLCKYAEVGLRELKARWQGKVSNQIQFDIQRLIGE
jgi:hypothetical protein